LSISIYIMFMGMYWSRQD